MLIKENEIEEHKVIHEEAIQFEEAENINVTVRNNPQEKLEPKKAKYNCDICGEILFKENEREEHEKMDRC